MPQGKNKVVYKLMVWESSLEGLIYAAIKDLIN